MTFFDLAGPRSAAEPGNSRNPIQSPEESGFVVPHAAQAAWPQAGPRLLQIVDREIMGHMSRSKVVISTIGALGRRLPGRASMLRLLADRAPQT